MTLTSIGVPQFVLNRFKRGGKGRTIYELDKETNAIGIRKVAEAASKRHLLTERDDTLLRGIENRANKVITAIHKGHLNISEDDRQVVDRLVCAMILNDPYSGFDAEETRKKAIAEVIAKLGEAVSRYGGMLDEPDFRDFLDERYNHDQVSDFIDSPSNRLVVALRLMGLQAYRPSDGSFFIIVGLACLGNSRCYEWRDKPTEPR